MTTDQRIAKLEHAVDMLASTFIDYLEVNGKHLAAAMIRDVLRDLHPDGIRCVCGWVSSDFIAHSVHATEMHPGVPPRHEGGDERRDIRGTET